MEKPVVEKTKGKWKVYNTCYKNVKMTTKKKTLCILIEKGSSEVHCFLQYNLIPQIYYSCNFHFIFIKMNGQDLTGPPLEDSPQERILIHKNSVSNMCLIFYCVHITFMFR
jgi:hypothetical protein